MKFYNLGDITFETDFSTHYYLGVFFSYSVLVALCIYTSWLYVYISVNSTSYHPLPPTGQLQGIWSNFLPGEQGFN